MSYAIEFHPSVNLLFVRFTGEITFAEEARAMEEAFQKYKVQENPLLLSDRRNSSFTSTPEDVKAYIKHVKEEIGQLGKPKVAIVVSSDLDFGMMRMFEALAESKLEHVFSVFRDMSEACRWLGVDENLISQ